MPISDVSLEACLTVIFEIPYLEDMNAESRQVSHHVGLIMIGQVDVVPHQAIRRQRVPELPEEILLPGINAISPVAESGVWYHYPHLQILQLLPRENGERSH